MVRSVGEGRDCVGGEGRRKSVGGDYVVRVIVNFLVVVAWIVKAIANMWIVIVGSDDCG